MSRATAMTTALAVLWAALNAVDLAETLYGLPLGHVEQNPLASLLYDAFGAAGLVGFKVALVGFALWVIHDTRERYPRFTLALLIFGCTIMAFTVIHNFTVLEAHGA